ncbi:MAG: hypothetical protein HQ580_02590 [Planctomycetes bacterium]|nr:hypothetical protein [Planctomycetota bacterium]
MRHLRTFILSEGSRYQELVPSVDMLKPSRTGEEKSCIGWAYCAGTSGKDLFLLYFEKDCPKASLAGATPQSKYKALWFNPRSGNWIGAGVLSADSAGRINLPNFPDKSTRSKTDWALKLTLRDAQ